MALYGMDQQRAFVCRQLMREGNDLLQHLGTLLPSPLAGQRHLDQPSGHFGNVRPKQLPFDCDRLGEELASFRKFAELTLDAGQIVQALLSDCGREDVLVVPSQGALT